MNYLFDAFGPTAPNALGMAWEGQGEILNALIQANQPLGQCILDSAEYLVMDASHDIVNNAIPAVLDGIAAGANWASNEFNNATTPPVPQAPELFWEQGPQR